MNFRPPFVIPSEVRHLTTPDEDAETAPFVFLIDIELPSGGAT
jgi:hypothetical protein